MSAPIPVTTQPTMPTPTPRSPHSYSPPNVQSQDHVPPSSSSVKVPRTYEAPPEFTSPRAVCKVPPPGAGFDLPQPPASPYRGRTHKSTGSGSSAIAIEHIPVSAQASDQPAFVSPSEFTSLRSSQNAYSQPTDQAAFVTSNDFISLRSSQNSEQFSSLRTSQNSTSPVTSPLQHSDPEQLDFFAVHGDKAFVNTSPQFGPQSQDVFTVPAGPAPSFFPAPTPPVEAEEFRGKMPVALHAIPNVRVIICYLLIL